MSTTIFNIQKAIYAKLTGDSTLMALITGVLDYIPSNQAFPYVTINDVSVTKQNTFGLKGKDYVVGIQIWSDYQGNAQSMGIFDRIDELLDYQTLTATGWTQIVHCRFEDFDTLIDKVRDKEVRRLVARYRVLAYA